jgi:hypoxanthine-guanine phosphoribosyltransferase
MYTYQKTGEVVEEKGAQVIVLNLEGVPEAEFKKNMAELAETIAKKFHQEQVVVEIQKGGITRETFGVYP